MRKSEISPVWGHGITIAICFFGWILLTILVDGIKTRAEASRAVSEAIVFTALAGIVQVGIWTCWCSFRVQRRMDGRAATTASVDGTD